MYSLMQEFQILRGEENRPLTLTLTAIRMSNDIDGNPRYKTHVWHDSKIWAPKVKGYRRSKDDSYVLKSVYDLEESMYEFVKVFEDSINEK